MFPLIARSCTSYRHGITTLTGCPDPIGGTSVKEGDVHQVSDFDDLLKGRKKLILLDDNLLAYPNVDRILEQMAGKNLSVNFTQTLDIRLLSRDLVTLLKQIGWSNTAFTRSVIHFSLNGLSGLDRITQKYQMFDFRTTDNVASLLNKFGERSD